MEKHGSNRLLLDNDGVNSMITLIWILMGEVRKKEHIALSQDTVLCWERQ